MSTFHLWAVSARVFSAGVDFQSASIDGARSVRLTLLNDAVRVELTVQNVRVDAEALTTVGNPDGRVRVSSIRLVGDFSIGLNGNGEPIVGAVRNESVQLGTVTVTFDSDILDFLLGTITNFVISLFENQISDALADYLFPTVREVLQDSLRGLDLNDIGGVVEIPGFAGRDPVDLNLGFKLSHLDVSGESSAHWSGLSVRWTFQCAISQCGRSDGARGRTNRSTSSTGRYVGSRILWTHQSSAFRYVESRRVRNSKLGRRLRR